MSECVVCRRQQEAERMACAVCETRMRDQLHDILEFYALAEGELLPGKTGGGRSSETSIGIRLGALDFIAGNDAVAVLASWESDWRETYGLTVAPMLSRPRPLLGRCVAFLEAWLPRACEDFAAIDDFAHELRDCWSVGQQSARVGGGVRSWAVDCPTDVEDGVCGNRLRVTRDDMTAHVTCRRCGTDWTVDRLLLVVASTSDAEMWLDGEAVCARLGISERTLLRWVKEGRIAKAHGLYDARALVGRVTAHQMSDLA